MSAVNNQVMTCPAIDPNSTQTNDYLLQKWTSGSGGKGVMSDSLPVEQDTGLITAAAIAGQVQTLINNGTIPMAKPDENGDYDMDALMVSDGKLYADLQSEFCWYQSRYLYALNQFLQAATLRQATDAGPANAMLATTQTLNKRANSVLQIISYLAQSRVSNIMSSKTGIDNLNTDINKKLAELQAGYALLNKDDALLTTQKEMVRYTEEKNNYTNNRIVVWTALNVLALGAIFYVYQKA
jgi:hypothetical protein